MYGWNNKGLNDLLCVVRNYSQTNELPEKTYLTKQMIYRIDPEVEKKTMCVMIVYRGDKYKKLDMYTKCKAPWCN